LKLSRFDDEQVRDAGSTLGADSTTHGGVGVLSTRVVTRVFVDRLDGIGIISATASTENVRLGLIIVQ